MKAIIIEEKDSKALLDALKLESFSNFHTKNIDDNRIPVTAVTIMVNDIHRRFHYVVTRWLQEQGASGLQ